MTPFIKQINVTLGVCSNTTYDFVLLQAHQNTLGNFFFHGTNEDLPCAKYISTKLSRPQTAMMCIHISGKDGVA